MSEIEFKNDFQAYIIFMKVLRNKLFFYQYYSKKNVSDDKYKIGKKAALHALRIFHRQHFKPYFKGGNIL